MNWDKFSDKLNESKKSLKLDPIGKEDSDINNDNVVDDSDSYLKKRREVITKNVSNAKMKKESLDPVGNEDEDIDNDGKKNTKSDKYLLNRRRVRNKIITSKVSEECGCESEKEDEKKEIDYRELKTKINLAKNKLRSMGLKMSYELDGSLVEGRKKDDDSYLETDMKKRRENNERAIEDMKKTKAHKDMVAAARKHFEGFEIEEGMSMKDFKANRKKLQRKEATADARKRGHEGKEWHNTGRTYSPDEAKSRRAKMSDDDRRNRYGSSEDPDSDDYSDYPASKTKDTKKLRKQKAMGEGYIAEKSLSRAQQRFMGMVYAAKKGETPASPEVAKAAEGISKKAARDFAKTKHAGLPEKKEETKEEVSLVQLMISKYSPLSEGKLDDLLKSIRDEDDGDTESKKPDSGEEQKKRVLQNKQSQTASPKRGKGATSSRERQVVASGATRVKAKAIEAKGKKETAKIEAEAKTRAEEEKTKREEMKGQRQKEKREYQQQDKAEKAVERQKKEAEARKEKEVSRKIARAEEEEAAKKQTRKEVKGAVKSAVKGMSLRTASSKGDATGAAAGAITGNVAQGAVALGQAAKGTAKALLKARAEKKEREKRDERAANIRKESETKTESFYSWRDGFLTEVDDLNDSESRVIDIMPKKKKNKIEINPKLDEAAPLIGILSRVVGGAVSRGVSSRLAGSAVSGSLQKKTSEFVGTKAGELTAQKVDDLMQKRKKEENPSGDTVLGQMSKIGEDWQAVNRKDKTDGLSQKAVDAYRRENPGSKLQTAVTEKKPTGKRAERRKSFCRRMEGMKKRLTSAETARDPDSRINKALRRWNCN